MESENSSPLNLRINDGRVDSHVSQTPFLLSSLLLFRVVDFLLELLRSNLHEIRYGERSLIYSSGFSVAHRYGRCTYVFMQHYWNAYAETQHSTIQGAFLKLVILIVVGTMIAKVYRILLSSYS